VLGKFGGEFEGIPGGEGPTLRFLFEREGGGLLPNRSTSASYPEASVETAGASTDVTGRHYNYIKCDDLVTKESVTNETMIRTRQVYALTDFLFDQPEWGVKDIIGTPYHFNDLYAELKRGKNLSKVVVPIAFPDGTPTMPERFTKRGIEEIRTKPGQTSYVFSCQYMLNPIPEDEQTFRPEWFEYADFRYVKPPDNLKKYIFVDPAATQRKSSDFTAMICIGIDEKNHFYVLDIIRDKLDVTGRINAVIQLAQKHGIHKAHYEAIGFQNTDLKMLKRLSMDIKYHMAIEPIKMSIQSKEDRIRALQPIYEQGLIHWPTDYRYHSKYEHQTVEMTQVLLDEMLMFPRCQHDDLIDAHSMMMRIGLIKAHKLKQPKIDNEFMKIRQMTIEDKKKKKEKGKGLYQFNNKKKPLRYIPTRRSLF